LVSQRLPNPEQSDTDQLEAAERLARTELEGYFTVGDTASPWEMAAAA